MKLIHSVEITFYLFLIKNIFNPQPLLSVAHYVAWRKAAAAKKDNIV